MEESRLYLVFEFLSMDLKKYMDTFRPDKLMDPELVRSYMYQITAAMLFCHQRRVLHRDLKPQNLLINKDGVIKVNLVGYDRCTAVLTLHFYYVCRWLTSDWGDRLAFRCACTRTRLSHFGIGRLRCCWARSAIRVLLMSGRWAASLPRCPHGNRCFRAIPRSTNCFEFSGKTTCSTRIYKCWVWLDILVANGWCERRNNPVSCLWQEELKCLFGRAKIHPKEIRV